MYFFFINWTLPLNKITMENKILFTILRLILNNLFKTKYKSILNSFITALLEFSAFFSGGRGGKHKQKNNIRQYFQYF